MTGAELHEIIEQLPDEAVEGASILLKRLAARQIDPDQEWCWSDEGQEKLRASLADIDTGRVRSFQTAEDSLEPSDRNAGLDEMSRYTITEGFLRAFKGLQMTTRKPFAAH